MASHDDASRTMSSHQPPMEVPADPDADPTGADPHRPSPGARANVADRRLHPLTLAFAAVKIGGNMIWPAIVGGFGIGGRLGAAIPIFLLVLAVPALIGAVLTYTNYWWSLTADELHLEFGVLNRQNRVIPLSRVQNVELRQNVIQRMFGVAELRVETAGVGADAEAVLSVLSLADAQAARAELLARRRPTRAEPSSTAAAGQAVPDDAPPLARLSTGDLLLAGATANEVGVIAAALAGVLQFVDDVPLPIIERTADRIAERVAGEPLTLGLMAALGFVLLGWMISIAGAIVRYYEFTLWVQGGELRKRYGLLTVHEASVPLRRVQAIRVEETILRRMLGHASLMIETAGGSPGQRGGAEAFVPITPMSQVPRLVRGIFGAYDAQTVHLNTVHPRAERRLAARALMWFAVLWAPFWAAWLLETGRWGEIAPWLTALLPVPWLVARWQYANRGWALPPGFVVARSGVLNRVTWIVPDARLQTLHLKSTPFQRRMGLATLVVDTAAGAAVVMDVGQAVGRAVQDTLATRMATTSARPAGSEPTAVDAGDGSMEEVDAGPGGDADGGMMEGEAGPGAGRSE